MRIVAWVTFAGTIVFGIVAGVSVIRAEGAIIGGVGIICGSFVGAFLAVAGIMIFLDMARDVANISRDVSEMRQELYEKCEKQKE